jgi:hypothetical protein
MKKPTHDTRTDEFYKFADGPDGISCRSNDQPNIVNDNIHLRATVSVTLASLDQRIGSGTYAAHHTHSFRSAARITVSPISKLVAVSY